MKEFLMLNKTIILNQRLIGEHIIKLASFNVPNFSNRPQKAHYLTIGKKINLTVHSHFDNKKRFYVHKIKPNLSQTELDKNETDLQLNKKVELVNEINGTVKDSKVVSVIDLSKDSKRKEIGFETESVTDTEWKQIRIDFNQILTNYSKLSKKNLTALVVATTMMGCVMSPMPFNLSTFLLTTLGTTLTSASANTFNQYLEVPYDSQMNRTKDRVLVRGNLTPLHAFTFASIVGVTGVTTLYLYANPLTAFLGASTLILYTLIYTPMKRLSPLNTWVGSIVGAIPPLMGWTAMTGQIDFAGLLLAGILYSWQFPHFHALSWNLRSEYSRAGYRMIAVLNPRICTSSALYHTMGLTLICSYLAPALELTTWNFAIDSLPFNLYFIYLAYKFKTNSDAQSSRKLFRYSLLYLPFIMLLMLITKYPIDNHTKPSDTSLLELLKTRLEHLNNKKSDFNNNINKVNSV
ncbi:unnamed protein product [Brachionus calyciflorus]|uniref:Protoheme IX farnesyltransferase, mitochondrial n=1 Tax=Brachionus calyciflorus TaxID=104777 RepID=A0A814LCX4_9BILA|nr:unnamed protein product [Brachionus calyciflorus]